MDAKVLAMISDMSARQLGGVILGAGFELPSDKSREALIDFVRRHYQSDQIDASDIYLEWQDV